MFCQNSSDRETSISKGKPAVKLKSRIHCSHTVISSPLLTTNESVPVIPEEEAMNYSEIRDSFAEPAKARVRVKMIIFINVIILSHLILH